MKNYDEWEHKETASLRSFSFYNEQYLSKKENVDLPKDMRWETDIHIAWAMCWSAVMSLPREAFLKNNLFFDENFTGWGVEDIEWGYRVNRAEIAIVLQEQIWGLHLPHLRHAEKNHSYEAQNFKKFLKKWPCLEVEVVVKFGDYKENQKFKAIKEDISKSTPNGKSPFHIIEDISVSSRKLYIGGIIDENGLKNSAGFPGLEKDVNSKTKNSLPLLGIALPYENHYFSKVYMSRDIKILSESLKTLIQDEAKRIANEVIQL